MNKLCLLLFIIIIPLFSCTKNIPVKNGYIDLSLHDFKIKKEVDLSGEWKFKWLEDDIKFSLANYDDSDWKAIKVPSFWNSITNTGHGYGWLRLKIKRKSNDALALYLPSCLTSFELFVNEKLVMQNGVFNKEKEGAIPQRLPLFIELPKDENLVIAWRISNYYDYFGGPDNSPRIGLTKELSHKLALIKFVDTLIIGAIFSLFIYYFILWMSFKRVQVHLLFSLLCLFIALRILAANYYIESIFSFNSITLFEIRSKIEYLIGFVGWALIPMIIYKLYPLKINKPFIYFIVYGTTAYSIFIMLTNANIYSRFIYFYQAFLILSGVLNVITLIIATLKRKKYAFILLMGFACFLGTVVHDILVSSKIIQTYNLLQIGLFTFLSSNSIILSLVFANSFKNEAYLASNLKKEVEIQTKTIEKQKQEIEKMLEQKTNMFVNLAHETKTPLTLIKNYIEGYLKKFTKPPEEIFLIQRNIDKLCNDVVNYLDAGKLEREQLFYNHDSVINFSKLLDEKIALFLNVAKKKGLNISSHIQEKVYFKADPESIDRVINNLLDNAIKYTEAGYINIELVAEKEKVILKLKDTGIGIPKEEQEHIFLPYYQATHKKRNTQGIGMGLYITKQIIDELKGLITVDSKLGEGTIFTISFPQHQLTESAQIINNYNLSQPIDQVKTVKLKEVEYNPALATILVVEDNQEMLFYIQANLKEKYNIIAAFSGEEALRKLNLTTKPDLIISDIMMDKMDGYQFYDELKAKVEYAAIPFIFLTAKTTSDAKLLGLEKGAIDYIFKPFSMKELTLKIEALLSLQVKKEKIYKEELKEKITKALDTESNTINTKFDTICRAHDITSREKEIIQLIKQGYSQKNIASDLNISLSTIKKHIDHIYKKCKIQTQIELINLFYD